MRRTEREFIALLRSEATRHQPREPRGAGSLRLRQGIGDDCAVLSLSPKADLLVTTDLFLEDIHFLRRRQPPDSVGHKALARGLSDIAAMGGIPRQAFLSLAVPKRTPDRWITEFLRGFLQLAKRHGLALAGGDTAALPHGIAADVVVLGAVPRGKGLLRSGARPGDQLWVSGSLGAAAHGLEVLRGNPRAAGRRPWMERFFYPEPRLAVGSLLRKRGCASAMMDLSDGLSIDLARLCERSGVGARLEEDSIPCAEGATRTQALHGGEDFELLFTVPPERARLVPRTVAGVPLTRVGEIVSGRRLRLVRAGKESSLPVLGFEHF